MRREVSPGIELDDDRERIDVATVHGYLSEHAYWALGRTYDTMQHLIRDAARVVGVYDGERQIGFCRVASDDATYAWLFDVYVLPEYRGRGLGMELVREAVENGPHARLRWILHTKDRHGLYARFGFAAPGERCMERPPGG
ncbi:MAG TPA: GNAT family N-acetyltransferase [Gaiellales bacterium]|nr:GNAT family N-acetyltransferase [Gaiellales bacterium]